MARQVTIVGYDKIEYTTTLDVLSCASCGVPFGIPRSLQRDRREDGKSFWCPNGHENVYRETESDKLRKQLATTKQRCEQAEDTARRQRNRAIDAERSAIAYKGVATKARKRAGHGVCPAGCNRQFTNLQRHMATKHPGYADAEVTP